jgi:Tfp pilus assembly protein PilE
MYPLVITALIAAIASALAIQSSANLDLMRLYRFNANRSQLVMVAENLEQYYNERGTFPSSLQALAQAPGYSHVRSLLNNWQGYAVSGALADSVWQYQRMVAFSNDPKAGMTPATYLSQNACGSGSFSTAASWCGTNKSVWFLKDTRHGVNDAITTQRSRLRRSLQKFGDFFSANGGFPSRDSSGTALVAGNTYSVASLAGFTGTASTCSGIYVWQGLPIGCDDMFDSWGKQVGFAYTSSTEFSLVSETPLINAAGEPLLVAAGFTM